MSGIFRRICILFDSPRTGFFFDETALPSICIPILLRRSRSFVVPIAVGDSTCPRRHLIRAGSLKSHG